MKKITQLSLVLLVMVAAFAGCDAANDAAGKAKEMAGFDPAAMQAKFTEIKDGFKDVTEESADGLASKISDFGDSVEEIKVDKLPAAAKTKASEMMTKVADFLKGQMEKISDEGILGKLKPAVEPLMEKLKAFGGVTSAS